MKCAQATCRKPHSKPPSEWHDGVMEDMQECHLIGLFPQHKENCVQHLNELGEVIEPANWCHPHSFWRLRVVYQITAKCIPCSPACHQKLIAHVNRQSHNKDVIDDEDPLQIKRFPVLHYLGPQRYYKIDVKCNDNDLRDRIRHEQPAFRPWVWIFHPLVIQLYSCRCKLLESHHCQRSEPWQNRRKFRYLCIPTHNSMSSRVHQGLWSSASRVAK